MRARRPALSQTVHIALATFDGAPWLEAQVRSLQAQDHRDWRLLARDDGSADGTPALLARLAGEEPRLTVLPPGPRLGVVGNFGAVLEAARADGARYVFPCDQDDVWHPGKLSRMLAAMARLEAERGAGAPLLVHGDLEVVDERLRRLHPSFLAQHGLRHEERDPLRVLLVQNFVTGCASLLNRALLDLALPLPAGCLMHDWWLAQCAAAAGALGFVPEPVLRYRQHGANQVGAGGALGDLAVHRARWWRRLLRMWRAGARAVGQAQALQARLQDRGGAAPGAAELVGRFASVGALPAWRRLRLVREAGIHRQRRIGQAVLLAQLALLGRAGPAGEVVPAADPR